MRHIILSTTVVALTAALIALSSLSVGAQEGGGQYAPETGQSVICAPWSKAWDLSNGQWYYDWYRWCVDPALYDPSVESSWYTETGGTGLGEVANLCPESGTCTMSPGGGMRMSVP